jgi:CRISPR-associated protein Csb2
VKLMLVLEIEFLTGRYVSQEYNDRQTGEWPPHPARVFSTLVAVHYEDPPSDGDVRQEREALEWLAGQSAPAIYASEATRRHVLDVFVPTNDKSVEPSVGDVVLESLVASEDRARAAARRKLDQLSQSASRPVTPSENEYRELIDAIKDIENRLEADGISSLGPLLDQLASRAREMVENRPSKLLARAASSAARLDRSNKERLKKQLTTLKQGLRPGKEVIKRALSVLPAAAERKQARTFPSVCPDDPIVYMAWDASPTAAVRRALDGLASRVTRLGHSSSFVRLAWVETPRAPTWIPDPHGELTLRWVEEPLRDQQGNVMEGTGQLAALDAAFELHRGTANRVLPSVPVNYRRCDDAARTAAVPESNVFGSDWVVFELLGSRRLPVVRAVDAALALRGAALRRAHDELCGCDLWQDRSQPPSCAEAQDCYKKLPAVLTGHEHDCSRARRPHVAFVALPFVGFPHADGSILGVAAILPRGLTGGDRRAVLRALGCVTRLTLAPGLAFEVRRAAEPRPRLRTLDPLLWAREGVVWGTVTPILLDRFPGNLRSRNPDAALKAEREAESAILEACERIGLPPPRAVSLTAPCFDGSVAAERFRRRDRRGLPPRVRVHALIDFGTAIRGPVLLGAGRYVGLGLCRPFLEGGSV